MKTHIVEYKGLKIYYYEPIYKIGNLDFPNFEEAQKYINHLTKDEEEKNNYYPTKTKPQ